VREVIPERPAKPMPFSHPAVRGVFQLRDHVLTLIDLGACLNVDRTGQKNEGARTIIVTEFNGVRLGFLIDRVERIHRLSWDRMLPVPALGLASTGESAPARAGNAVGVVSLDQALVLMIDFESVADAILNEGKLHATPVPNDRKVDRASRRVVFAEDSAFMRAQIQAIMIASGYTQVEAYPDGQACWDAISQGGRPVDVVISDIEMPRMDGLHLTRRIRAHAPLADVPVILFSSLISDDNANKGRAVGATAQVPKPELQEIVRLADRAVLGEAIESVDARRAA